MLHKNLDEDLEKRQKLIASMSKDEFYSAIARESVYKKIEDEKTRNDLKEFYGDEYQYMIFKEAVKCTDKQLSTRTTSRDHTEIVDKVVAMEQPKIQVQKQNDYLKDYTLPEKNR